MSRRSIKNKFDHNICQCPKCSSNQFFIFDSIGLIRPILYCTDCDELIAYLNNKDIKTAKEIVDKQRKTLKMYKEIDEYISDKEFNLYNRYSYQYYSLVQLIRDFCLKNHIDKIEQ